MGCYYILFEISMWLGTLPILVPVTKTVCTVGVKKSFHFCNTEWKGRSISRKRKRNDRAIPFRSATILRSHKQLGWTFRGSAYCQFTTRLSAWSSPVVIFHAGGSSSFSLTRRQRGRQSSSRVTGSAEEQTERNGLAVVIQSRNKGNGQKQKLFLTHTVLPSTATFRLQFCPSSVQPYSILCV